MDHLRIVPYTNDICNCLEGLEISVLQWLHKDFEMLFTDAWRFTYDSNNELDDVTNRLKIKQEYHFDMLKIFYGVNANILYLNNYNDTFSQIEKELMQNRPVIAYTDTFYCDWITHAYNQSHSTHCILVTGIDKNTKQLYFVDSSPHVLGRELSLETFNQMNKNRLIIFKFEKNTEKISVNKIYKILKNKMPKENEIGNISCFCSDLVNLDYNKEIYNYKYKMFDCKLVNKLQEVARGRGQYSLLLALLSRKFNLHNLHLISEQFDHLSKKWMMVRGLLVKSCYEKNTENSMKKIMEILRNIEKQELELLARINKEDTILIQSICTKPKWVSPKDVAECIPVAIERYFNNKGFGNEEKGCFTCSGGVFLETDFMKKTVWKYGTVMFNFEHIINLSYDNIVCKGQTIELPEGKYKAMYLLGCSEWGSFIDTMELLYKVQMVTTEINFSDWGIKAPVFMNETVFWHGKAMAIDDINKTFLFDANIYCIVIPLNQNKELISVKLPDCTSMHIFAITCCK